METRIDGVQQLERQSTSVKAGRKRRSVKRWRSSDTIAGYLFIFPAIFGFLLFIGYPLVFSGYYAFTNWNGLNDPTWVGLKNFQYLFTKDPAFWPSLRATAYFGLLAVPSTLVLGLLLALLLNRTFPGVKLFRTIMYLPVVLPVVAVLTLWKYIYDPTFGLANMLLSTLHLPTSLWLGSDQMALPAMVIIGLWGVGGSMVIFLAGLQAVPNEIYEAAKIDGAGTLSIFWRITLRMISPILFLQLVLQLTAAFQAFAQPKLLTEGGPDFATDLFMYKIYKDGFSGAFPQIGYATAEVWVLFLIILVVTALTFRSSSMWVYADNNLD
ncbi:carbohydrate ABC transporter permease [Tengunoibacter tsumagoiensis]|uniref:Sugar ABC transporter permease n=1 Tax=Tengunoibacter tsumagoiensis TaxID=2014871 RepID=A0A401ZTG1_9CHLR|nr:sugar ABC transporter permease [Tengunoibacter tsumagoiensis]GCE10198.1 sugar ABC transporter permease [Tengunoibacter tsumagoiensis]